MSGSVTRLLTFAEAADRGAEILVVPGHDIPVLIEWRTLGRFGVKRWPHGSHVRVEFSARPAQSSRLKRAHVVVMRRPSLCTHGLEAIWTKAGTRMYSVCRAHAETLLPEPEKFYAVTAKVKSSPVPGRPPKTWQGSKGRRR